MAEISELIDNYITTGGGLDTLSATLEEMKYDEVLELLENSPEEHQVIIFDLLDEYIANKCFKVLPERAQQMLVKNMNHKKAARLLNSLPDDDLMAFIEGLPSRVVNEWLKLLSDENRKNVLVLLGYPENSVGRLMTPHYVAVKKDWTVAQVLEYIRQKGQNSETVDVIYVVEGGVLIDDIRLREFLFVDPTTKVSEVMDHRFISLDVSEQETEAINVFRKNNRFALPVVDARGILLGIVTMDDVLRLVEAEDTADIQQIGGSDALDEPYNTISFFSLIKKRAGWLVILFFGEMLTAWAMGYFQDEISKAVVLALFIPLIISSGGNSGSQASSIIIRAMALGEITFADWWRVMSKELLSGFILGTILGSIGFLRIFIWQNAHIYNYGEHWLLLSFTIFFSLIGVVMWGTFSGSMLPLVLKRVGADPAASSAPFVATLVDVTGLIIYFSVAFIILRGTLL
ncbi:MAG TPA: magnesium transporter [Chitinophagales bacterium]|nr:magnesium transporter [Chitinophagales bacterium]